MNFLHQSFYRRLWVEADAVRALEKNTLETSQCNTVSDRPFSSSENPKTYEFAKIR